MSNNVNDPAAVAADAAATKAYDEAVAAGHTPSLQEVTAAKERAARSAERGAVKSPTTGASPASTELHARTVTSGATGPDGVKFTPVAAPAVRKPKPTDVVEFINPQEKDNRGPDNKQTKKHIGIITSVVNDNVVNLIYVSDDPTKDDQDGRKVERVMSVPQSSMSKADRGNNLHKGQWTFVDIE